MSLALVVALVTVAGRLLLTHFDQEIRVNAVCLMAISFIVGLGLYTWLLYLSLLVGMPMNIWTVGGVVSVLLVAGFLLRRKPAEGSPRARLLELLGKRKIGDWGLLAALAPLVLFSGYVAFKTPIYFPDAIFYYDGMGRTLFVDGSIYAPEVKANLFFLGVPALFLPLIHATSYALLADRVAVLYAGFYAAMVLMFGFLR